MWQPTSKEKHHEYCSLLRWTISVNGLLIAKLGAFDALSGGNRAHDALSELMMLDVLVAGLMMPMRAHDALIVL